MVLHARSTSAAAPDEMSKSMDGREAKHATAIAVTEGLSSALPVALASGAAIGLGHKFHAGFAKNVGASGKVAMAIMPPFFAFVLAGEHAINRTVREGGAAAAAGGAAARTGSTWHLRAANYFHHHTLICFGAIITPMYGAILSNELAKPRPPTWRFSHAIIHTRVFGQAAAVVSLVLCFGFKDIMTKAGAPFDVGDD